MEFRDLKRQYRRIQTDIDRNIKTVIESARYIQGEEVQQLEKALAEYVGVKYCVSCANGTDALQLALMVWNIGPGDAVFVPDFTFFSSGEAVSMVGATPIFVDVKEDTFNINPESLEYQIEKLNRTCDLTPKVVIAVDLFGLPADYDSITKICRKNNLLLLEDGAQGFGGRIGDKKSCSFGDISTTSFFPAKPLGCYGDGGAVFTDNDEWASLLKSYCVHGKGNNKYDNIRIGMNSRLDTIQAAILNAKLPVFINEELDSEQRISKEYTECLENMVSIPKITDGYYSSWAQYTVKMKSVEERNSLQKYLKENDIPSMVYYQKPMHRQKAFDNYYYDETDYEVCNRLCDTVLSLPFHPYMDRNEIRYVTDVIRDCMRKENG